MEVNKTLQSKLKNSVLDQSVLKTLQVDSKLAINLSNKKAKNAKPAHSYLQTINYKKQPIFNEALEEPVSFDLIKVRGLPDLKSGRDAEARTHESIEEEESDDAISQPSQITSREGSSEHNMKRRSTHVIPNNQVKRTDTTIILNNTVNTVQRLTDVNSLLNLGGLSQM